MQLSFEQAAAPIREDFTTAHERFWSRLASPGAWWSGEDRVAIAAEIRHAPTCELCKARKDALSPSMIQGEHDSISALPAAAIDVIHRVTNDSGRLTKSWFEEVTGEGGISQGQYVELIGTISALISIDKFCRGVGSPLHPLPTAEPGEPTQYRPPGAVQSSDAWMPIIQEATGNEADIYGGGITSGNVIKAMSLVPDEVRTLLELSDAHYLQLKKIRDFGSEIPERAIDRMQIELIAGRISALRGCYY